MRYLKHPILVLFVMAFFFSCNNSSEEKKGANGTANQASKAKSSGSHAELLVIIDDALWASKVGLALKKQIAQPFPGLPTPESLFNVIPVSPTGVTALLKRTKSVIVVEERDTSVYRVERNLWAQPQIVVYISGSKAEIAHHIRQNAKEFTHLFREHDKSLLQARLSKNAYQDLPPAMKKMGIKKMLIPKNLELATDHDSVLVFWSRGMKTDQGLLVYKRPMRDDILPGQDVVAARNAVCKIYIPGVFDGSYMTTETDMPPTQAMVSLGGQFGIETRGIWKTEGDKMGGPFISYTIYPEQTDHIITVEGWFYGPGIKKRNFMLEMEAYLQTIQF